MNSKLRHLWICLETIGITTKQKRSAFSTQNSYFKSWDPHHYKSPSFIRFRDYINREMLRQNCHRSILLWKNKSTISAKHACTIHACFQIKINNKYSFDFGAPCINFTLKCPNYPHYLHRNFQVVLSGFTAYVSCICSECMFLL